jgi:hypothetical protein
MPEAPKSLLLRVVLVGVSPIVARVLSVPDSLSLEELHEVMLLLLGWESHHFYSFRVHGQEISRRFWLRRRRLKEFDLRRREKLLYTYSSVPRSGEVLPARGGARAGPALSIGVTRTGS